MSQISEQQQRPTLRRVKQDPKSRAKAAHSKGVPGGREVDVTCVQVRKVVYIEKGCRHLNGIRRMW